MRCLKLVLAYEGTAYCGWQVQNDQPTIQATLERALTNVTGEDIRVTTMAFADALAAVERGDVVSAPAIIALQWLALHRDRLRERWRR